MAVPSSALYPIIPSCFVGFLSFFFFFLFSLDWFCSRYLGIDLTRSVLSFGRSVDALNITLLMKLYCPVREGDDSL